MSAMTVLAQSVTLSWEEGEQKEEMELWDIQLDSKGRLDWAAVKEAFNADVVEILHEGSPPLLDEDPWEGFTMQTFQPGSTILVSVSCKTQGMAACLLLLTELHVSRASDDVSLTETMACRHALPAIVRAKRQRADNVSHTFCGLFMVEKSTNTSNEL